MRQSVVTATLLAAVLFAGCAASRPMGIEEYYAGDRASAERLFRRGLDRERNSRALYLLLLGTVYLEDGRLEEAREKFIEATEIMESFVAEGEFAALVGREAAKQYKGDPYERMMAWWYLGLLDYALGDYHMALPSFKSSIIANSPPGDEAYMADNASGYLMTAKTYIAMGDASQALREFEDALVAGAIRKDSMTLFNAISRAARELKATRADGHFVQLAADLTIAAAPGVVYDSEDLSAGVMRAGEAAGARLAEARESGELDEDDAEVLAESIHAVSTMAARLLRGAGVPKGGAEDLEALHPAGGSGNIFVVTGIGSGPYKYNTGAYGRLVAFGRRPYSQRYARVFVNGRQVGRTVTIEDIYYQAVNRGPRAMDSILAGKAVLKGGLEVAAAIAFESALADDDRERLEDEEDSDGFLDNMFTGMMLALMAALVRPEADVRSWETLPDRIQALTAEVEPGEHDIEVAFYNAAGLRVGAPLRFRGVPVHADRETVLYVRSGVGGWAASPVNGRSVVTPE